MRSTGTGQHMPHVNDRRAFAECGRLIGGPQSLNYAARVNGRRVIDTTIPGQQNFQALLLWYLLSPLRTIPWDSSPGRSFRDMHSYWSWASPQPDRLASGWSVAARVASYLLPRPRIDATGQHYSGMPGLRFVGTGKSKIQLTHIPTGGNLDLYDRHPTSAKEMESSLLSETGLAHSISAAGALWAKPEITSIELNALADWTLVPHAALLSAMMARIGILWRHWENRAELIVSPSTGSPQLSWWEGPSAERLAQLLTNSAIGIEGARRVRMGSHELCVVLGESALELRGPGTLVKPSDS
jgi:hypothetical protein